MNKHVLATQVWTLGPGFYTPPREPVFRGKVVLKMNVLYNHFTFCAVFRHVR
jgi:hypothetical protein